MATHRQLWLLRHGATEWARDGRHTGNSNIPLLPEGEDEARRLAPVLSHQRFAAVFSSPLQRAQRTCELAGLGADMTVMNELLEWNYGDYEGITTLDIQRTVPGWNVFTHGCPNGEDAQAVQQRCETAIGIAMKTPGEGDVALFAHGHLLRALAGTWVGMGAIGGRLLMLSTGSLCVLGFEHGNHAIVRWNAPADGQF